MYLGWKQAEAHVSMSTTGNPYNEQARSARRRWSRNNGSLQVRMSMIDLPRFADIDQVALRELHTPEPQPAA